MKITSQMLENLKYDEIQMSEEPNSLKINADSKVKYYKIEGLNCSYHEVQQKIKENVDQLARIESNQMCIPFNIAKKYFEKASEPIDFYKVDSKSDKMCNTLSAVWRTDVCTFFKDFCFAIHLNKQINLKVDPPRQNLIKYFFENILKMNLVEVKADLSPQFESTMVSIIFKLSDINAAVQQIIESLNDPFNTTKSVNSIYVQESCFDDLCEKLKLQLKPYPNDILRDQFFNEEYNNYMKVLNQLQPKLIQLHQTKSNHVVPTICCNFNRKFFQTNSSSFSPIITLESFRTVKECLSLLSDIPYNWISNATIWSYNFATAYEVIYKSNLSNFELNCYNVSKCPLYAMFNHNISLNGDEINNKNGVVNTNTHHYEYFHYKKDDKLKFKTVIMAFGVTFAN